MHDLIDFNVYLVGIAMRYQLAAQLARSEVPPEKDKRTDEEIGTRQREIVNEFEQSDMDSSESFQKFQSASADMLITIFDRYGLGGSSSVESILFFMLQSAWTAIEIMFADLWEAALNECPHGLCQFKSTNQKPTETSKQLSLDLVNEFLKKNQFNLSKVMGSMHRASGRFNFTKLDSARAAYKAAFLRNEGDVIAAISSDSFSGLAAMRHVLVHKAGYADTEFFKAARKLPLLAKWKNLEDKEKIEITGEDTRNLIVPALATGFELIHAVDEWIANHPPTSFK